MTLLTWNIHRCIGTDGEYRPDRIRSVLRDLDADIVALQEVECFHHDPNLLDFLCAGNDWKPISGITLQRDSGAYGNALLCRYPVNRVERIDISVGRQEPRGVIDARIELPGSRSARGLRILATHLGLGMLERRAQLHKLRALVEGSGDRPVPDITVLMGDLNEWLPGSRSMRRLRRQFQKVRAPRTFPVRRPWLALDHVWLRGPARILGLEAIATPSTRIASDHLPLLVRCRIA